MYQIVKSFFRVIQVLARGSSRVETTLMDNVVLHKHQILLNNGTLRTIIFRCKQHRHTVYYQMWYLVKRTYYTYTVEMVQVGDSGFKDYHQGHYPELCVRWLHASDYPYYCAINAHIDAIQQNNI